MRQSECTVIATVRIIALALLAPMQHALAAAAISPPLDESGPFLLQTPAPGLGRFSLNTEAPQRSPVPQTLSFGALHPVNVSAANPWVEASNADATDKSAIFASQSFPADVTTEHWLAFGAMVLSGAEVSPEVARARAENARKANHWIYNPPQIQRASGGRR